MAETVQERMARQRAAREARDGTPEERAAQAKRIAGQRAQLRVARSMVKVFRLGRTLVLDAEKETGHRAPSSVRRAFGIE